MQLYPDLWIKGGYYIDFDQLGQWRIIGPNNHLFLGLINLPRQRVAIHTISDEANASVRITGRWQCSAGQSLTLSYPLMGDMRTLREIMRSVPNFAHIRQFHPADFWPHEIKITTRRGETQLTLRRRYGDHFYQCIFIFPRGCTVKPLPDAQAGVTVTARTSWLPFTLIAETDDWAATRLPELFLTKPIQFNWTMFGRLAPLVKRELQLTELEIHHLLLWRKTSGDRFGSVFPRDWMEAADLGVHDLTAVARMHMYRESLRHVNAAGVGWHEDVVGELRERYRQTGQEIIDRHMIDIEPHYIIGIEKLPDDFLVERSVREKIRRVAHYVITQARKRQPIIFKPMGRGRYFLKGNWRDSTGAYKEISPVVAPFDVNAVFYPKALKVLHDKAELLALPAHDLDHLLQDWSTVKERYRFTNPDGRTAFALALFDTAGQPWRQLTKKTKRLAVNHLDESYYFTYLDGTAAEVESFADRLLDPKYFYTPSGPLLVAKNNRYGYTAEEYHGQVIWTKQVAYVILGLSKHLKTAIIQDWPLPLKKKIRQAIVTTCENMIQVYHRLGYVPELHKDVRGKPALPANPEDVSRVQLWSAVGARRIFRKYHDMKTDLRYKF